MKKMRPVGYSSCHFVLPNKFQHPQDQLNPFYVEIFISARYFVVFLNCNQILNNPQTTTQMVRLAMQPHSHCNIRLGPTSHCTHTSVKAKIIIMGSSQTDRKNVKSKCDVIWPQTTLDEK
jgi:hypothetical protein